MNLDSLSTTTGEWLRGSGPEPDIVISSRIRLARNLAAFPFTNRASVHQKAEIEGLLRERIGKLEVEPRLAYENLASRSAIDRQFLVERQLISRELATTEGPQAASSFRRPKASASHGQRGKTFTLRLQVMPQRPAALDDAWQEMLTASTICSSSGVSYAFHDEFGYA